MKDLFDTLSDFLSSDLSKDYRLTIIVVLIFVVVITVFVVSLIFIKLIIPAKLREAGDIMPKYENALAENEVLREKILELNKKLSEYKQTGNMVEAINSTNSKMQEDTALKGFLKKGGNNLD